MVVAVDSITYPEACQGVHTQSPKSVTLGLKTFISDLWLLDISKYILKRSKNSKNRNARLPRGIRGCLRAGFV
jgi:hypothetical protein